MKKIFLFVLIFVLSFSLLLSSCNKKRNKKDNDNTDDTGKIVDNVTGDIKFNLSISDSSLTLNVGETKNVDISSTSEVDLKNIKLDYDHSIISVTNDGTKLSITALKEGSDSIKITYDGYDEWYEINVKIALVIIEKIAEVTYSEVPASIYVDESFTISFKTTTTVNFEWKSDDEAILSVVDGKVTALKKGTATITLILTTSDDKVEKAWTINVVEREKELISDVTYNEVPTSLYVGDVFTITYATKTNVLCNWESNDSSVISVSDGLITALKKGSATITLTLSTVDDSKIKSWVISVNEAVVDTTAPEIELKGVEKDIKLSWGKTFDPLEGIVATDDIDGDITSKISVEGEVDNKSYGKYVVKYKVSDRAGNEAKLVRNVEVVWDYAVKFIGHAG